jgi:3-hydroxybutyryl-CoA dehydrogenase
MAVSFALGGHHVSLADATPELAAAGRERLLNEAVSFVERGLYPVDAADILGERISAAKQVADAVSGATYIAEVVSERIDIKSGVLSSVADVAPEDAIIATNTSAIPIRELEVHVRRPERFLGVHWMNPAQFVPGVEIIAGNFTEAEVVTRCTELVRGIGKVPVKVPDTPGFIANRLQYVLHKESSRLVEEGLISADELDAVVSNSFGFRLAFFGPMAIADMAGLDVYVDTYRSLHHELGEEFAAPKYLQELVSGGRLGVKQGGGLTQLSKARPEVITSYRNAAYSSLSQLKAEIGVAPSGGQ